MTTVSDIAVLWRKRQHFPLDRATLCLDCDVVFELEGLCPACGSEHIYSVARFLNREIAWKP